MLLSQPPSCTEISKQTDQIDAQVNIDITEEISSMRFSGGYLNSAVLSPKSERWVMCSCLSLPAWQYLSRTDHLSGGKYIQGEVSTTPKGDHKTHPLFALFLYFISSGNIESW